MSKFSVKVGRARSSGAKPPSGEGHKAIHPGLDLGVAEEEYRCRKCGVHFSMAGVYSNHCRCGLWFRVSVFLKFLRFTSGEYIPGEGPVTKEDMRCWQA